MRREVHGTVAAPPAQVWAVVADPPRTAAWSEEIQSCVWNGDVEVARPGDTFTAHMRMGDLSWSSTSTVTFADPGRVFAFAVSGVEHPTAVWTWELTPAGAGTAVTYAVVLGDGPSMFAAVAGDDPGRLQEVKRSRMDLLEGAMGATLRCLQAGFGPVS